jgi:DNA-binding response OmpR family regulator
MRVLVVEDHEDLAANIGDFLASHGHTVDFALDGLVGLNLALTGEHDVIVLDLTLPRLDGLALCDRLRRQGERQTPVLMLTARDTLEDKLEGFESGADDYLIKPFELRELEARLGRSAAAGSQAAAGADGGRSRARPGSLDGEARRAAIEALPYSTGTAQAPDGGGP